VRDLGDRGYLALRLRDEFASDLTAGSRAALRESLHRRGIMRSAQKAVVSVDVRTWSAAGLQEEQ
jgi:hypothetical protein